MTTRKIDQPVRGHIGANPVLVLRLLNASSGGRFLSEISFISERKRSALALADHPQAARYDLVPVSRQTVDRLAPANDHLRKTMLLSLSRTGLVSRRSATALLERTADPELDQALGYFYDEIATATLGEEQLTYDLSVPANVTYVANGFVSHNTIAFMMDCDTTGIEPDIALIKYKKLVGEGYLKIVNQTVPGALRKLGYTPDQVEEIVAYVDERETIEGAPDLGAGAPLRLRLRLQAAQRRAQSILPMGHVRMMARGPAVPVGGDQQDRQHARGSHRRRRSSRSTSRAGSGASRRSRSTATTASAASRLSTSKLKSDDETKAASEVIEELRRQLAAAQVEAIKPHRRRLPAERTALTHKFDIAGHEGYITVGLYPDGQPGEIFLKMAKEGSTVSRPDGHVRHRDQPLAPVRRAAHATSSTSSPTSGSSRRGFTGNQEIPIAKSVIDYIFRWLGSRFLVGDDKAALGLQERGAGRRASSVRLRRGTCPAGRRGSVGDRRGDGAADHHGNRHRDGRRSIPGGSAHRDGPGRRAGGRGREQRPRERQRPQRTATATAGAVSALAASLGLDRTAFKIQEDAPSCADCGSIMVRNGSCYKCLNCGSTSGCS